MNPVWNCLSWMCTETLPFCKFKKRLGPAHVIIECIPVVLLGIKNLRPIFVIFGGIWIKLIKDDLQPKWLTRPTGVPYFEFSFYLYEPRHEITGNVVCVTSKASDQPVDLRSLIRAFASRLHIL